MSLAQKAPTAWVSLQVRLTCSHQAAVLCADTNGRPSPAPCIGKAALVALAN